MSDEKYMIKLLIKNSLLELLKYVQKTAFFQKK